MPLPELNSSNCYQFVVWLPDDPHSYLISPIDNFYAVEKLVGYDSDTGTRTTHYLGRIYLEEREGDFFPFETVGLDNLAALQKLVPLIQEASPSQIPPGWGKGVHADITWESRKEKGWHTHHETLIESTPKDAPCRYCDCDNCQGKFLEFEDQSILLSDGNRICGVCWYYPPCGTSDDCQEFFLTGRCKHRPKVVPYPESIPSSSFRELGYPKG